MREQRKVKVVCDVCVRGEVKLKPGEVAEIQPINKEQIQEILDTLENRKRRN
jgi:predicted DNA-binding antitoxin AbrB/MazE fold protein